MSKLIQVMVHLNHYGNKDLWIENDRKDFRVICILIHFNTCATESFINRLCNSQGCVLQENLRQSHKYFQSLGIIYNEQNLRHNFIYTTTLMFIIIFYSLVNKPLISL